MFKALSCLALSLLLCSCATVDPDATQGSPIERVAKGVTYKIAMDPAVPDGRCSATAVGPAALLTAKHCTDHIAGDVILLDGSPVLVDQVIVDDMDHAVIVLALHKFPRHAKMAKVPHVGDAVFIWGNSMFNEFLRRGYISTFVWDKPFINIPAGTGWMVIDMRVSGGDSGSGIFNDRGQLIGVLTGVSMTQSSAYGTSMPFNFKQAAVKPHVPNARHLTPRRA